jgi:ketosteroid isomerase-like protein
MKCFLAIMVIAVPLFVQAQSKDEKEVRANFHQSLEAWNAGDIAGYMDTYDKSDSILFINKSLIAYGWKDANETFRKAFPTKESMGKLTYDIKIVKQLSENFWLVVGSFHVDRGKDSFGGNFSDLVQRIKGSWKVVVDHS